MYNSTTARACIYDQKMLTLKNVRMRGTVAMMVRICVFLSLSGRPPPSTWCERCARARSRRQFSVFVAIFSRECASVMFFVCKS